MQVANIFYPAEEGPTREGILIGYNFEGFIFVVADIVPFDRITSLATVQEIITEPKF